MEEAKENVYGFDKQRLNSPTSLKMLDSFSIKKADVESFDKMHQAIKKRKNESKLGNNSGANSAVKYQEPGTSQSFYK